MKKIIYILFALCMILNQKIISQANDYQIYNAQSTSELCYVGSVSDDSDYLDDYLDELNNYNSKLNAYIQLDDMFSDYSSDTGNQNNSIIIMIVVLVYIIQGCIFGFATQKIIENKGHKENWFWWGFFFGFVALLVALSKPQLHNSALGEQGLLRGIAEEVAENRLMREGGWECAFCHRKNEKVVTTCICGKSKDDTSEKIRQEKKTQMEQQQSRKNDTEINTIELLEKYKKLLDAGALTQEEFDTKKKQLLNR